MTGKTRDDPSPRKDRSGQGNSRIQYAAACDADPKTQLFTVNVVAWRGDMLVTLTEQLTAEGKSPEELIHQVAVITAKLCEQGLKDVFLLIFEKTKREKRKT